MEIPVNDGRLNEKEQSIVDSIIKQALDGLKEYSITKVYKYSSAGGEHYHRIAGRLLKEKGYYIAFDYIPNGYQGMVVSKSPLGEPSGRLVSREFY